MSNKYPSPNDIDHIISAKIPSHEDDPELYTLVQNHMVHGPCGNLGKGSPYRKEGKYSRFYPKKFQPHTLLDADGYPGYDRVTVVIVHDENDATLHVATHHDEIKDYLDCRYA
ncbi:hypothetical protein JHK84_050019 [Glycine max]|nr:hypothetical protein JHK84_050019 [Glycine max]